MDDELPPDFIKGTYTTDLNINKINEAVITRLNYYHRNCNRIRDIIDDLTKSLSDRTKPDNEIKLIRQDIIKLESSFNDYFNNISLNLYKEKTNELLINYTKVASNKSKGIIYFKKIKEQENENLVKERLSIIRKYLDIAKEYIKLDIVHKLYLKATCPSCGTDLNSFFVEDDLGMTICPNCGHERESISHHSTFRDSQRVNIGNRNNYDDCDNFRKALLRFQGRQIHKPPLKLYEQLDAYFQMINKPVSKDVRIMSIEECKKIGISREMMFEALSETNNSAYYDDINLILNTYWGWDLPDISQLEDRIMEDYIMTQQVYNSIPEKDRNASLNIQFRLYVHLKAVDYPCNKDDFKIQTSRDSLIFHNEMWKYMCDHTGVKFHSVI